MAITYSEGGTAPSSEEVDACIIRSHSEMVSHIDDMHFSDGVIDNDGAAKSDCFLKRDSDCVL